MSVVSNNIKYLRRIKGLTQEQFARKIGIKRSLLGAYEEGRANPNYENLMAMANFFGQSVDSLMKTDIRKQGEMNGSIGILNTFKNDEIKAPVSLEELLNDLNKETIIKEVQNGNQSLKDVFPNPVVVGPVVSTNKDQKNFRSLDNEVLNAFEQPVNSFISSKITNNIENEVQKIEWVSQKNIQNYLANFSSAGFINQLPCIQLPMLPHGIYRGFEAGNDFPLPGSTIVGSAVQNWFDIKDGQPYIIVAWKRGIMFRRVFNQVKIKGTLLLSSDDSSFPTIEIHVKEILEAWELKMFMSFQLPEPKQHIHALDRLSHLASEMQKEIKLIGNG